MQLQASRVFEKNWLSKSKITINRGGSSSTKTWSLLQVFVLKLMTEENILISVVRQTMPALKKSVLKDFTDYLFTIGLRDKFQHNKTDQTFYNTETNSMIEFFSVDDEQKARGPRREYLWVNEANEIKYDIFRQLLIRTRKQVFIDFNPSDPNIWINKELELIRMPTKGDVTLIKSNYLDNGFLTDHEKEEIANLKPVYNDRGDLVSGDPSFWKVFGLGEYGSISGLIFKEPKKISKKEFDDVWIKETYGLDFGYTHDPTALICCKYDKENKRLYLDQRIYEKGLDPDQIDQMLNMVLTNNGTIVADSAEQEQIAYLLKKGHNIVGAKKGPGSVKMGIELLKRLDIFITEESLELIKEFGLYKWREDKNGDSIGQPVDMYNHGIDATRYDVSFDESEAYGKFQGGYG